VKGRSRPEAAPEVIAATETNVTRTVSDVIKMPLTDPFWTRVDMSGDDCWPWLGPLNETGYGTVWRGGRKLKAHRVAYELAVGPVPDGLELDHLCRVRACVRPAHLEPVTHRVNLNRARSRSVARIKKMTGRASTCPCGDRVADPQSGLCWRCDR